MNTPSLLNQIENKEIKQVLPTGFYNHLDHFLKTFSYNSGKTEVQNEIALINSNIELLQEDLIDTYSKLSGYWKNVVIIGIIACLVALLFIVLLHNNRKKSFNLELQQQELQKAKTNVGVDQVAKRNFLNIISHEIRTPLNAVVGLSHILMDLNPSQEQKNYIEMLQFSSENLKQLLQDILDFEKLESHKIILNQKAFHFGNHLRTIAKSLEPYANSKNLRVHIEMHDVNCCQVEGDPDRIGQVLYHLIENAIKFTSKGSIRIVFDHIDQTSDQCTYEIKVIDSGIGIAPQDQQKIFDNFNQIDQQTNRKYEGSGLGLTIAQRLLALMDSQLVLKSEPDKGSEFSFQLTLSIHNENSVNNTMNNKPENCENKRVLVVEDNRINYLILAKYLDNLNIKHESATNGIEGVQKATTEVYDLVLMDLQMPEMDGYEASDLIREELGEKTPPIIAITAASSFNFENNLTKHGIADFVSKPIDPTDFTKKLEHYLTIP